MPSHDVQGVVVIAFSTSKQASRYVGGTFRVAAQSSHPKCHMVLSLKRTQDISAAQDTFCKHPKLLSHMDEGASILSLGKTILLGYQSLTCRPLRVPTGESLQFR